MARSSKKLVPSNRVDLTSFLDIISILFVIQLLMLCILALSTGYSNITQKAIEHNKKQIKPDFLITKSENDSQASNATLLHCANDSVDQYDGNSKRLVARHTIQDSSVFEQSPTGIGTFDYAYALIEPSCFKNLDKLLDELKQWSFVKIGYEPLPHDHNIEWLK